MIIMILIAVAIILILSITLTITGRLNSFGKSFEGKTTPFTKDDFIANLTAKKISQKQAFEIYEIIQKSLPASKDSIRHTDDLYDFYKLSLEELEDILNQISHTLYQQPANPNQLDDLRMDYKFSCTVLDLLRILGKK